MRLKETVDLSPQGGMIDTPEATPDGYARELVNMFYRNGSWITRAGARLVNATAFGDFFAGMWAFKSINSVSATWDLVAATRGDPGVVAARFCRLVGTGFTPIQFNNVATPEFSEEQYWRPWQGGQISDAVVYACRRTQKASGVLYHVTKDQVTGAGVAAPPTPTVVTSGTAGALSAGNYPVACRYVTSDGQYSPMSESQIVAISASEKRSWSLTASTHPRVTGIELMVGFVGGDEDSVYFAYLAPNATGTVEEDVLDSAYDLARTANFRLVVPPENPEDAWMFDARLWLITNDPSPTIWMSYIDVNGSSFETFDPQVALSLPVRGGRRYQAGRAWDRSRCAVLTDSSVHVIEPGVGQAYTIRDLDLEHGAVSAAACDIGAGILVWFDGRNVLASDGGPAKVVSRGWVDKALSQVPAAYAERAVLKYTPDDGGAFWLSIPGSDDSTENDLVLCWDTQQWHARSYFAATYAPVAMARIPSEGSQWITVASFLNLGRVVRIDSPVRRDEGPFNIPCSVETSGIKLPDGYGSVSVSQVRVGLRRRADTTTEDPGIPITASCKLRLNGLTDTAPVSATMSAGNQILPFRAQNLGRPAADVSVVITLDHPDIVEIFSVHAECVFFKRHEVRS